MKADGFVKLCSFSGVASAQVARSLLEADDVRCLLDPSDAFGVALVSGSQGVTLLVDRAQLHRARMLLEANDWGDGEVQFHDLSGEGAETS